MKITHGTILTIILAICFLPGGAAARPGISQVKFFDSLYSNAASGGSAALTTVPDPKSTQVQVYIFKKSTVLWSKAIPGLPPLVPGAIPASGKILVKDPQVAKVIQKYAKQHGVDPKLVQAMIRQESGFNPIAVSPKGAMGLMQLMPETAASLGVEDPFDVDQNIKGGVRFLKTCLQKFDQNLPLALAAYNAGPGRVVEHQGVPPFKETHTYVKKIVQEYCGQEVDPAQIKLGQPGESKEPPKPSGMAAQPQVPSLAQGPVDLTFFATPSLERMDLPAGPEKSTLMKNGQLSIY
jgi:hypothetical protein